MQTKMAPIGTLPYHLNEFLINQFEVTTFKIDSAIFFIPSFPG